MNTSTRDMVFFSEPEHQPFELGDGPVGVLLIHGFMGTPAEMRPLGTRLAQEGYSAKGILLPGFGPDIPHLAESNRRIWLEAAADAWQAVQSQYDQSVLLGFSMGGAIAMHLAAKNPPDALVLLAPFWQMNSWQFRLLPVLKYFVPSIAPFEKANFDDPAIREQLAGIAPGIDITEPDTQRFLREQVRLPLAVLDEVRQLGIAAGKLAPQITAPSLILQGKADVTVQPASTRRLAERFGGLVTYHEVNGDHGFVRPDRHAPHFIDTDLLAFLSALPLRTVVN